MNEIDFFRDDFSDIVSRDDRYDAKAYALLTKCIKTLTSGDKHARGEEIAEEFRCTALDLFGPLTYRVLTEWGLKRTEDIGEMMFNLVETKRIKQDDGDSIESFARQYDFKEEFLAPFEP